MRARNHHLRVSGKRINAIGIMSCTGVEDVYLTEGNVDGDVFEDFVRTTTLLPLLMPFNGINSHSVVIMDNASIHHMKITDMIEGVGALVRFLPPYSPNLNPIEEVFSKIKQFLKANDSLYISTVSPCSFVAMAFNTVSKIDCIGYIQHAGYMH